jgi:hypothetical protein
MMKVLIEEVSRCSIALASSPFEHRAGFGCRQTGRGTYLGKADCGLPRI